MEQDYDGSKREKLFFFKLQEQFDRRYVLQEGEYRLFRMVVIGFFSLLLAAVATAFFTIVIHAPSVLK